MKEVSEAPSTSRLAGRRKGKPAAVSVQHDNPALQRTALSTSRADQRPGVLIVGSCRGEVFVADELLIHAETLGAEEAVHAWLAQHGIQMAPKEKVSTRRSARDAVGKMPFDPAKARHDGGNDKR